MPQKEGMVCAKAQWQAGLMCNVALLNPATTPQEETSHLVDEETEVLEG